MSVLALRIRGEPARYRDLGGQQPSWVTASISNGWIAPLGIGLIGRRAVVSGVLGRGSCRRAPGAELAAFRAEWRARDIEAKIRLSGNAVENIAIAMAANPALDQQQFDQVAARAAAGLAHVNALEWAPRVKRDDIPAFEAAARARGLSDYRVFDVTPDFHPTELGDRPEYFPVLYEQRFHGARRVQGLALGRYDGRRIPMEKAAAEGVPIATTPVRPIGRNAQGLVYLLYWPVYDTIEVPATAADRQARLRGYAVGNYELVPLFAAVLNDTPAIVEINPRRRLGHASSRPGGHGGDHLFGDERQESNWRRPAMAGSAATRRTGSFASCAISRSSISIGT